MTDPELASHLRIEEREFEGGAELARARCDRLRRLVRGICTAPSGGYRVMVALGLVLIKGEDERSWQPLEEEEHCA